MIVVIDQIDFFSLFVIEDTSTYVQTVLQCVIVIKYLIQRKGFRIVYTQNATYRTYYDLIYLVVTKKYLTFLQNETNQVYNPHYLLILYLH